MAITETARLLASLELQDKFSPVIKTVEGKIDGVTRKLDGIGTATVRGVDTAKRRLGTFRDALSDTNTQVGIVGTSLAAIENFVPPELRPFVTGLEQINRTAPTGIAGAVAGALKPLTDRLLSPDGIGVKGRMILAGETIGLILAVNAVATSIRDGIAHQADELRLQSQTFAKDASIQDLEGGIAATNAALAQLRADPIGTFILGGHAVDELEAIHQELHDALAIRTGDVRSPDRLDATRSSGNTGGSGGSFFSTTFEDGSTLTRSAFQIIGQLTSIKTGGVKWIPAGTVQVEDRRGESNDARILEKLEANRLATLRSKTNVTISVPVTIKNTSLGGTTTTVYSRYSTSVTGTGGNQI